MPGYSRLRARAVRRPMERDRDRLPHQSLV
nr:MAG TPA: hypothetical protein [Caudoviricetes sp.]